MGLGRLAASLATCVVAGGLGACAIEAADQIDNSFARLGPADAPVKLHYSDEGEGPPVLLLHGFGASTFTWRYIAPELTKTHRVIAVDLKGFGQSDKPFDERYSARDQAELLTELIEEQDLRNLTLIGHSFGGGVALLLALQEDERLKGRIAKLVLLDTIAYPQEIPTFFQMLNMPVVSQIGVRMVPVEAQIRVALKIAYYDDSKIDDAQVAAYAEPLRSAAGKHAVIHTARQIVPPDIEALSERYKSITLPTLILWCDHDRIVPLDIGLKLRRKLPKSTLRIISACGHMPQEEQPKATLELIQGFLAKTG